MNKIAIFILIVLMVACASIEDESLVCFGWCAQHHLKKGEYKLGDDVFKVDTNEEP
jgi:hypothetical protein